MTADELMAAFLSVPEGPRALDVLADGLDEMLLRGDFEQASAVLARRGEMYRSAQLLADMLAKPWSRHLAGEGCGR